jgi:acetyl-CoA C-acetyltransferase
MDTIKDKVAIIGMGCTRFGELFDKGIDDLIVEASYEAFEDAQVDPKEIQAAWLGTCITAKTGTVLSQALKLDYIPVTRVENACATGADAFRNACYSVAAGVYDLVLVVGMEKLKDSGLSGLPNFRKHPVFYEGETPPGHYAFAAKRYFEQYDVGKETLAKIAVKNHYNGSLTSKAHFRKPVTLEQVMNAPIISWPLGLLDCCPVTDGAAAAIITRGGLAKNFRDDYILVKGFGAAIGPGCGTITDEYDFCHWEETERAAQVAYKEVGIRNPRKELDLAIVHDCFTISEIMVYEGLGFSKKGQSKEDVDSGVFELGGELPVNTDGGLLSFGHPIGASGIRMMYEIYKQIQGKAEKRQLKNPTLGLAHSQGGVPGWFQCVITILGSRD